MEIISFEKRTFEEIATGSLRAAGGKSVPRTRREGNK